MGLHFTGERPNRQSRMDAAWELIVHACKVKGMDVDQLRLQRTVERFGRQQRSN